MLRIFGTLFYAAIALIILSLVFTNREHVNVSLAPLHAPIEAPLYIWLSAMFALGLGLGLLHSLSLSLKLGRKLRRQSRALNRLEEDLSRLPGPIAKP